MVVAAAALIALAVFAASQAFFSSRMAVTRLRLARIAVYGENEVSPETGGRMPRPEAAPAAAGIASTAPTSLLGRLRANIDWKLTAAGQPVSTSTFYKILACTPPALGGLILLALWGSGVEVLAVLVASFGVAGPMVWLSGSVVRRGKQINRELPDTLDLIVVSLEAGLGFEAALLRITERSNGILAEELRRVLAEVNVGLGRRAALQAFAARTGLSSIASLVSAIVQAEQTGMSIAQVLRAQSDHLRIVRRQRAEEAAMKAPLKMLFPLVFFIFPSLFVVILGPAVLQLLKAMSSSR